PPLCSTYDEARPGICPNCIFWNRVRSPASLLFWERMSMRPEDVKRVMREVAALLDACQKRGDSDQKKLGFLLLEIDKVRAADPTLAADCAFKLMRLALAHCTTQAGLLSLVGVDAGVEPTAAQRFATKLERIATTN